MARRHSQPDLETEWELGRRALSGLGLTADALAAAAELGFPRAVKVARAVGVNLDAAAAVTHGRLVRFTGRQVVRALNKIHPAGNNPE